MWGEFVRSALLLLLTAVLTGLAIPLIIKAIDERRKQEAQAAEEWRLRERTEFEATLARQTKVIEAQAAFLDRLADLVWEFQLLLIAVPYYRQFPSRRQQYDEAQHAYLSSAGNLLGRLRAEVSKSLRLTPPEMYDQLNSLYYDKLLPADLQLTSLIEADQANTSTHSNEWSQLLRAAVNDLCVDVDNVISALARTFRLSWSTEEERVRLADVERRSRKNGVDTAHAPGDASIGKEVRDG